MRLAADRIVVRYRGGRAPALDGVTIDVPGGSLYAVLGPNGSGKSTLVKALLGVVAPESGRSLVDGRVTTAWSRRELARVVGVVPQSETIAFPMSVRDMVGMGRYPHLGLLAPEGDRDREAVAGALAACSVDDLAERDLTTLSGGELQRVRIARALAQEPRALVLDEPTASLDIRHEMTILELLRVSADRGMTVLLVTHGLDMAARFADRMLLLSRGRVAAEGRPEEVMTAGIIGDVYRWRVSVESNPVSGSPRVTPLRPGGHA